LDQSAEGRLKQRVLDVLVNNDSHVSELDWLPVLYERLKSEPKKWKWLAFHLVSGVTTTDEAVKEQLREFEKLDDSVIREVAKKALAWLPDAVLTYMHYDKNRDGELTKEEIPSGWLEAVLTADADKNGTVSTAELIEGVADIQNQLDAAHAAQGGGGGGFF
jgi:hypothetical protein